jgi:hypothetical protein
VILVLNYALFKLAVFCLWQSDKVHKVTQFQMTGWSPAGLCTNHMALIALVKQVTAEQMRMENKPIVIHGR